MAFDPAKYLAEDSGPAPAKTSSKGAKFDPAKYLAGDAEPVEAVPAASEDTGGAMPATFNVKDAIAETMAQPNAKPDLPGNTPRLASPGDPNRPQIAIDSAVASGENAETPEHKATRQYNALLAGSQDAVPFFPRIRAGVMAGVAGLQGKPMGPAYDAEFENSQKQISDAKAGSPVHAAIGAAPVMLATPGGLAKTVGGRVAGGAAVGGLYGASAVDHPGATLAELAEGAGVGVLAGTAGAGVGEAIGKYGVRGASPREDRAFMREMTITDGGEGSAAMLAKNKEGLARDYKKIIELRRDPEIRAAARAPGEEGAKVMADKIKPFADAQGPRYDAIDAALAHPANGKVMTGAKLLDALEEAKKGVSARAAEKIAYVQEDLRTHWMPRVWGKDENAGIPAKDFREWLSDVQATASNTPGALNWTATHASTTEASRAAKKIFNDYLDSANLPGVADAIRRDNVPISVMSTMRSAMEAKAKKEQLQSMGLGQVMAQQNRGLTRAGAAAAAVHGNLPAAAALLAEPYAEKGAVKGLRWMNGLMDRMNLAAEQGATRAQIVRYAIENGAPGGLANVAADRLARKMVPNPSENAKPGGKHDFLVPMTMGGGKD
jgi:hypothetical protein